MTLDSKRVLLVWDDRTTALSTAAALEAAGGQTRCEPDSLSGLVSVETWEPALIVLDWGQRLINGPTFLAALEAGLRAPPPVIALVEVHEVAQASGTRAAAVITKPLDVPQLVHLIGHLLAD